MASDFRHVTKRLHVFAAVEADVVAWLRDLLELLVEIKPNEDRNDTRSESHKGNKRLDLCRFS